VIGRTFSEVFESYCGSGPNTIHKEEETAYRLNSLPKYDFMNGRVSLACCAQTTGL